MSLSALYAPQMLEDTLGIAHNSVLGWSFARRCRLAIPAAGEIPRANGTLQPSHKCAFLFHEGLYGTYTKINQSDLTVDT